MTKSLVDSLLGLYRHFFKDMSAYHPSLRQDFERDYLRLETLASKMGPKVFTLALPALGKFFESCLESKRLTRTGIPLTRSFSRRTMIPRLFKGLWLRVFDINGCLKHDIDPNDILFLRTLFCAAKKYRSDCAPHATFRAVKEFYDVERTLPPASHEWATDGSDLRNCHDRSLLDLRGNAGDLFAQDHVLGDDDRLLLVCQNVADRVSSLLGEYSPRRARFRHGPGAVSDLKVGKAYKYAFPNWGPRLQFVFPASEFAFANLRESVETDDYEYAGLAHSEPASILYAVPKTQKGPRLIAAEPTCHQWAQQSVRSFLNDAIKESALGESIDFSRQDLSGKLALSASIDKTLATVDLSSASDRLSCFVIERMFRRNYSLLSAFIACRTRYVINGIDKKSPKLYELRKFASMGSALTFPVQSICFYIACVTAGLAYHGLDARHWVQIGKSVRVYGDDLIVPVSWMPFVERILHLLLLKVNRSKTFSEGNFRESCGTDAYLGNNVSPGQVLEFYDESRLTTIQTAVETSNNLYLKGFWNAAAFCLASVPRWVHNMLPCVQLDGESFGLISASGSRNPTKCRWNVDLQREEYYSLKFVSKRSSTLRHEGRANLLQYFTEDPSLSLLSEWESGVFARPLTVVSKGWVPSL
ncbi:MAG: putative replicase protein [Garnievirus montiscola]|uniref:RNA-directed RNA polymerase n=1 Tax=Leviviridae sp. TaxID=2027243 RepID=A0ABY3SU69_9VIRU|nr:MAG: putative replicase protein [Leviviridae sp.]